MVPQYDSRQWHQTVLAVILFFNGLHLQGNKKTVSLKNVIAEAVKMINLLKLNP